MKNESGAGKEHNKWLGYVGAIVVGFIMGLRNNPKRQSNGKVEQEDPLVQYTKKLGRATQALVLVGILSFGAALLQWSALRDANRTTRESFSEVQRPFITATGLNITQQAYGATSPQYWEFQTTLENSGNTPTKNMTVTSSVSFSVPVVPDTGPDPANLTASEHPRPMSTDYFIGPRGKVGIWALSLHFKTAQEMAQSRSDFYIFGIARYWDQFSDTPERLTKFCFVVRPVIVSGNTQFGFDLCHHWNCGDEDCARDEQNYKSDLHTYLEKNPRAIEIKRDIPVATILPYFPIPEIKAQ